MSHIRRQDDAPEINYYAYRDRATKKYLNSRNRDRNRTMQSHIRQRPPNYRGAVTPAGGALEQKPPPTRNFGNPSGCGRHDAVPLGPLLSVFIFDDINRVGLKLPYNGIRYFDDNPLCKFCDSCKHTHGSLPQTERSKINNPVRPRSVTPAGGCGEAYGIEGVGKPTGKGKPEKPKSPVDTLSCSPTKADQGTLEWSYVNRCLAVEKSR